MVCGCGLGRCRWQMLPLQHILVIPFVAHPSNNSQPDKSIEKLPKELKVQIMSTSGRLHKLSSLSTSYKASNNLRHPFVLLIQGLSTTIKRRLQGFCNTLFDIWFVKTLSWYYSVHLKHLVVSLKPFLLP